MNLSLLQSIRPLVVTVAMTLLLASCGDGHSPNTPGDDSEDLSLVEEDGGRGDGVGTIAPGEPNPSTPISSVEALVAQLSETGVDVTYQGQSLERSFFLPAAHLININGQDVALGRFKAVNNNFEIEFPSNSLIGS